MDDFIKPFEYQQTSKNLGISNDYIKEISKILNTDMDLVYTSSFKESRELLKSKKCDGLILSSYKKEDTRDLLSTSSYLSLPYVIATHSDSFYIYDIGQIKNKKIGVIKAYSFVDRLKEKYSDLEIIEYESIDEAMKELSSYKIYAFIDLASSIASSIKKYNLIDIKISGQLEDRWELKLVSSKDEPLLNEILEYGINSLSSEFKNDILNKWQMTNIQNGIISTFFWALSIFFVFIFILFLFGFQKLKKAKEIAQKAKNDLEILNNELEVRVAEELEKNLKKEKLIMQQSRLAQMGEIISMIAHQWRQPLSSVSLTIVAMKLKLDLKKFDFKSKKGRKEFKKYTYKQFSDIQNSINNLSDLIDDFRTFYKPSRKKVQISVDELILKSLNMISFSLIEDDIEIISELGCDCEISLYDNEMMQVILNILKNSQDSLSLNGVENKKIIIRTRSINDDVIMEFEDNGGGIDEDILPHIFDPYFSTKEDKNGTGLGLHMSRIIVSDHHNGTLSARNTPVGVKFVIELKK